VWKQIFVVGFEVLAPFVMKSSAFWDVTPCSPLKGGRRFSGCLTFNGLHLPFILTGEVKKELKDIVSKLQLSRS
jgi:hypothetical protein